MHVHTAPHATSCAITDARRKSTARREVVAQLLCIGDQQCSALLYSICPRPPDQGLSFVTCLLYDFHKYFSTLSVRA